MSEAPLRCGSVAMGGGSPLGVIAGPCAAESRDLCLRVAETMRDACHARGLGYVFKASFDKANRSSLDSDRGPGLEEGLRMLSAVRSEVGVPTTADIHEPRQASPAAEAVDLLQIPAFLCRQTDLLVAAARTGRAVNVKKGQFVAPEEMQSAANKLRAAGADADGVMLTERGTFFGYHRLVNDFLGLGDLQAVGYPVCFDATHSTQMPGAGSGGGARVSGGRRDRSPDLARCAVAAGVDAVFLETHPRPSEARSDAATMLPLEEVAPLLDSLTRVRDAIVNGP